MYSPPSQTNFLEILKKTFEKIDIDKKEIYILSNFNINMHNNNKYIVRFITQFRKSSCLMMLNVITNFV